MSHATAEYFEGAGENDGSPPSEYARFAVWSASHLSIVVGSSAPAGINRRHYPSAAKLHQSSRVSSAVFCAFATRTDSAKIFHSVLSCLLIFFGIFYSDFESTGWPNKHGCKISALAVCSGDVGRRRKAWICLEKGNLIREVSPVLEEFPI